MSNTSNTILDAVNVLTDVKLSALKFDKTIIAQIVKVVDAVESKYQVTYEGAVFTVTNQTSDIFKEGDNVYVTVLQGDFSNDKIIVGKAKSSSSSAEAAFDLQVIHNIGPNWGVFYDSLPQALNERYGVCAGENGVAGTTITIWENPSGPIKNGFQRYSNQYKLIRLAASFQNDFINLTAANGGNFGLKFNFYVSDDPSQIIEYELDMDDFTGNPYDYSVASPQYVILEQFELGYLKGLQSIELFQRGFNSKDYDNANNFIDVANIWVNNFELGFADQSDLAIDQYYLNILSPQGLEVGEGLSITLQPQLIYGYTNVLTDTSDKWSIEWFQQDIQVTLESDAFNNHAGVGWRLLDTQSGILSLNADDVYLTNKYKCVVIYNDTIFTKDIVITNKDNDNDKFSFKVNLSSAGCKINLLVDGEPNTNYCGDWSMLSANGLYTYPIAEKVDTINIDAVNLIPSATVYCKVYQKDIQGNYIELCIISEDVVYQNIASTDISVGFAGDTMHHYAADGQSRDLHASQSKQLVVTVTPTDGEIDDLSYEWYINNHQIGTSFTEISECMITKAMVSAEDGIDRRPTKLTYFIKPVYAFNYQPVTIELKVVNNAASTEYHFYKEIYFLKDGDQGTNGTPYTSVISVHSSDAEPLKLNDTLTLEAHTYKDGNEIVSGVQRTWRVGTDKDANSLLEGTTDAQGNFVIQLKSDATSSLYAYSFVELITTIGGDSKTTIYTYFPIDFTFDGVDSVECNLPKRIKYDASGYNPNVSSFPLEFTCGELETEVQLYNAVSTYTRIFSDGDKAFPASSFLLTDGDSSFGHIELFKCIIHDTNQDMIVYHPVLYYCESFGNKQINNWDGKGIEVDEAEGTILAPQIGAGHKNTTTNKFTGVMLGDVQGLSQTGLYGYKDGLATFGFRTDGTAFIGPTDGRIEIDGQNATIQGKAGTKTMTLQLGASSTKTLAINVAGKFTVDYAGNVDIDSGTLTAPTINGGIISGGTIEITGTGRHAGGTSALYIKDNTIMKGWISYDSSEGKMWITSDTNVPLKITSGGNMSLTANKRIYLESNLMLKNGVNYGSSLPAVPDEQGEIFFLYTP